MKAKIQTSFFNARSRRLKATQGETAGVDIYFEYDNISFVLPVLGDSQFYESHQHLIPSTNDLMGYLHFQQAHRLAEEQAYKTIIDKGSVPDTALDPTCLSKVPSDTHQFLPMPTQRILPEYSEDQSSYITRLCDQAAINPAGVFGSFNNIPIVIPGFSTGIMLSSQDILGYFNYEMLHFIANRHRCP